MRLEYLWTSWNFSGWEVVLLSYLCFYSIIYLYRYGFMDILFYILCYNLNTTLLICCQIVPALVIGTLLIGSFVCCLMPLESYVSFPTLLNSLPVLLHSSKLCSFSSLGDTWTAAQGQSSIRVTQKNSALQGILYLLEVVSNYLENTTHSSTIQ